MRKTTKNKTYTAREIIIIRKNGNTNDWIICDIFPTLRGNTRTNNVPRIIIKKYGKKH